MVGSNLSLLSRRRILGIVTILLCSSSSWSSFVDLHGLGMADAFILPNSNLRSNNNNVIRRHMRSNEERDGKIPRTPRAQAPPSRSQQQQQQRQRPQQSSQRRRPDEPPQPPPNYDQRRAPSSFEKQEMVYTGLEGLDLYEVQKQETRDKTQGYLFDPGMLEAHLRYEENVHQYYNEPLMIDEDDLQEERRQKEREKQRRIAEMDARIKAEKEEEEKEKRRRRQDNKKELLAAARRDRNKKGTSKSDEQEDEEDMLSLELMIQQLKDDTAQMTKQHSQDHDEDEYDDGDDDDHDHTKYSSSSSSSLEWEMQQLKDEISELKNGQTMMMENLLKSQDILDLVVEAYKQQQQQQQPKTAKNEERKNRYDSDDDDNDDDGEEETFVIGMTP